MVTILRLDRHFRGRGVESINCFTFFAKMNQMTVPFAEGDGFNQVVINQVYLYHKIH